MKKYLFVLRIIFINHLMLSSQDDIQEPSYYLKNATTVPTIHKYIAH